MAVESSSTSMDRLDIQTEDDGAMTTPLIGFLIIDELGVVFGTLHGTVKCLLYRSEFNIPSNIPSKNHRRGGQSTHCSRGMWMKQNKHMHKLAEVWAHIHESFFNVNNKCTPQVESLFVAGRGWWLKTRFCDSQLLDERVRALIQQPLLDISSKGETGFHEAINKACSGDSRLVRERGLLIDWMKLIAQGPEDRVVSGVHATMQAYEADVISHLIMWDHLPGVRYTVQREDGTTHVHIGQTPPKLNHGDTLTGETSLIDWILHTGPKKGTHVTLVTNLTHQGLQFCQGFRGMGGYLCHAWTPPEEDDSLEESADAHTVDDYWV